MNEKKLPLSFYQREDVLTIGKELLGKFLFTSSQKVLTGGMIVEVESYAGASDRASHAYGNRFTQRTKTLYEEGGIAYVYLCYGIHHLLNVVTHQKGIPHAVLIRAIMPTVGVEEMLKRTKKQILDFSLTSGPGALTKALGITKKQNELSFQSNFLWIEDRSVQIPEEKILKTPRVGVAYAKEDAILPWRFRIKDHPWTSPAS